MQTSTEPNNMTAQIKRRNVLVFPAGSAIGLEIGHALKYCKEVRLFGAGVNNSNHALFTFPEYHLVPIIHEEGWVAALSALCQKLKIDYIFPAYDDVIVALRENEHLLPAKIIGSPKDTCFLTRSKSSTYRFFGKEVRVPSLHHVPIAGSQYPVIVKPDKGQGSQGVALCKDATELEHALKTVSEPIVCEYLPGDEYTIDCFSDRDRGLLFAGARTRGRTANGISISSRTESVPELDEMAQTIAKKLDLRGAWFFQAKRATDGKFALLEIGPRISGTMAAHRVMGLNFPLLSIFEEERLPIVVTLNTGTIEIHRALANRYKHVVKFKTLYIDLDDTLLLNNAINTLAIKLVYQAINAKKKIILVTRRAENLDVVLKRFRLHHLFDEIIAVPIGQAKSTFITEKDAIFVDDSFSERMDVFNSHNIPTFDCSMIELLTEQAESIEGEHDE